MPSIPVEEWLAWLASLYNQYGYLVVFLSALAENTAILGLIMPGGTLILLGAFYAREGVLSLPLVILWGTLGTIIGYHIDFLLGRFVLAWIIKRSSATRVGKRLRLAARARLAQRLVAKYGGKAILISHIAGHIRSFVAMSAGMMRMRYTTFLLYEVIAATIWTSIYALIGFVIAINADELAGLIQRMGLLLFLIIVAAYLLWRFVKTRIEQRLRKNAYSKRNAKDDMIVH